MIELAAIGLFLVAVIYLASRNGALSTTSKAQKELIEHVKKTKKLHRSLRNKRIRNKLRNYFK